MKHLEKTTDFCRAYGLRMPIIMAPMAGASPTELAAAVSNAGGMGACGVLPLKPDQISIWAKKFRSETNGAFLLNSWVPDPEPIQNSSHEKLMRAFLSSFGPEVPPVDASTFQISFEEQCQAMLEACPNVISSIMGLYEPAFVNKMKRQGIKWFATVTSVTEALMAQQAGADALVVQGSEAGGHRGNFYSDYDQSSGLMALLPVISDVINLPLIATGGIADSRSISAAILLGASAVQIGTGLLRTPEAAIKSAWADAIKVTRPEDTIITRAFSGKPGRAIRNLYTDAAHKKDSPIPTPYPVQRALTEGMRSNASDKNKIDNMQAWTGQAASLAKEMNARDLVTSLWSEVENKFR
ncbi:nitronate monooxygenase [Candidatus Puniceispirillum sp.]|nr:nitronate monooxygenase [Candidatus Puniceispirillum sp.]